MNRLFFINIIISLYNYIKGLFVSFDEQREYWNNNFDMISYDSGYNMVDNQMPVCEYVTLDNNSKIKTIALAFLSSEKEEAFFFVV